MFIVGQSIQIRPAANSDIPLLYRMSNMDVPHHALARSRMMWGLNKFASEIHQRSVEDILLVIGGDSHSPIHGYALVNDIRPWDGRCSLSVYLSPSQRSSMVEAHLLVNDYLFKWFPLNQIEYQASSTEVDSPEILAMFGYERYGRLETAFTTNRWTAGVDLLRLVRSSWSQGRSLALTSIAVSKAVDKTNGAN